MNLGIFGEDIPSISNREVRVRIRSVALNYRHVATPQYPFFIKDQVVLCSDAAGEIVEVGNALTKELAEGDRVVCALDPSYLTNGRQSMESAQGGPTDGVLRQFIALPARAVVKVPLKFPSSFAH